MQCLDAQTTSAKYLVQYAAVRNLTAPSSMELVSYSRCYEYIAYISWPNHDPGSNNVNSLRPGVLVLTTQIVNLITQNAKHNLLDTVQYYYYLYFLFH